MPRSNHARSARRDWTPRHRPRRAKLHSHRDVLRHAVAVFLFALAAGSATFAFAETAITAPAFGPPNSRGIPVTMDGFPLSMTGTAFFVSKDGYAITPFHVAGGCSRRAILRPEGAYEARAIAMYAPQDIAVLKSDAPHKTAHLAATSGMNAATQFVIVRYLHLGGIGSRSVLSAKFLGRVRLPPIDFVVRAADKVVGGNSGSPIVRLDGGVAAMVTAVSRDDPHVTLGIGSDVLSQALQLASVPFQWQSEKLPVSAEAGGAAAANEAIGFTFPIACYTAKKS